MANLSPNFNREEFACKCGCGADTVDAELITVLERVREHFDRPVAINSAHRCYTYNRSIGSTDESQHPLGRAADISISMIPPAVVQDFLEERYPDKYGIGRYSTFTHIDTRNERARW